MFNIATLDHMNQLSVAKQRDRRRRRRISRKVAASPVGGFFVLSSEHREHLLGARRILQRNPDSRTHAAGGASADGIHHYHSRPSLAGNGTIHFFSTSQFLNSHAG